MKNEIRLLSLVLATSVMAGIPALVSGQEEAAAGGAEDATATASSEATAAAESGEAAAAPATSGTGEASDAPATADDSQPPAAAAENELIPVARDEGPMVGVTAEAMLDEEREGQELISIALDDVPLEDVVRMFTRITDANIIAVATNLEGSVTVNLTDVQWEPALRSILDMHNLSLVERTPGTGVYSIMPKSPDAPEPMVVETIFLRYTTTTDVGPILRGVMASGAMVSAFPSRNALVIKSTEANLGEMKQIVAELDLPGKQVCIETKFMELNETAASQLGLRWDSLEQFNVGVGVGPFTHTEDVTSTRSKDNSRTRWDRRQNLDQVDERYDVDNVQYEESTTTFEESPPGSGNWIANSVVTPTRTVTDTIDSGEDNQSQIVTSFAKSIAQSQAAILNLDTFNVVLSALKKTDGVTIISNPKLIVANGATNAQFSVGEREPIIRKDIQRGTTDSPGDIITAQLDTDINTDHISQGYLATGIDLQVIPVVKTDDLIEADIRPSLKRKIADKEVEGNTWPVISVKEIRTKFTLRSGQTVAIGGLTDTQDGKLVNKVPLLGDIPLLGKYVFSHTADTVRQVETIIFVTLSLAQAEDLRKTDGIPGDAELVHKRMLQAEARRQKFLADMQALREVQHDEAAHKAKRAKSRLLRRRK